MKSTVTVRGQTVVPAKIRRAHQIEPNSRLEWIDDGASIRVVPVLDDPVRSVRGRTRGLTDLLLVTREAERQAD